jgi:hypothetical protein
VTSTIRFEATATASKGIQRVEFWVDGRRVATDSRAPYRSQVAVSGLHSGTHTATARAFDTAGQAASSAALVRVSRKSKGASARAAAVSAPRGAQLGTAAAGEDATRLAGEAPKQRMVRATLTRCDDGKGAVADRASLRADSHGRLDAMRDQAGLCVLKLALTS